MILLTKGYAAIVDAADFNWLSQWRWHTRVSNNGKVYAIRVKWDYGVKPPRATWIRMHNFILGIERGTDHRNGDGLDNRRANLRRATRSQNMRNIKVRFDSTSGITGVTWDIRNKKWQVHIFLNSKQVFLGRYESKEEAAQVRRAAEQRHYGEFVRGSH